MRFSVYFVSAFVVALSLKSFAQLFQDGRSIHKSRLQVDNLKRIMDQWTAAQSGSSAVDMPLARSVRTARSLLKKYVSMNGVPSGSTGRDSYGTVQYGDVNSCEKYPPPNSSPSFSFPLG